MIKWLQVEATTKCNAWCPGCKRNQGGYQLNPLLVLEDLDFDTYVRHLETLPGLDVIDFCGTYGDAIAAHHIKDLTEVSKKYCKKIIIRTNGSLRNKDWWQDYSEILKNFNHEIWFCIDGLKDTHSIYRQATDFDTVIEHAKTVINNGCTAVWQFIPFAHNEHQIKECIKLSQELGFKRFEFYKNVRLDFVPRHYQTGKVYEIKEWSKNQLFSNLVSKKTKLEFSNCRHLSQPSLYLNANGKLSNCCFFNTEICGNSVHELPNIQQELLSPRDICLHFCGQ